MTWHQPPQHPTPPPYISPQMPSDLVLILGRLLERTEQKAAQLDRIEARLERGDLRMDSHGERLTALEAKPKGEPLPGWERLVKGALPYLVGLATLWGTGSIETALKVFTGIK